MFNVDLSGNVIYHGTFGSSTNMVNPVDIAVDSAGNVYVADPQNDQITGNRNSRIRKYDNDGAFVGNIAGTALSDNTYLPYGLDVADVTQY